MEAHAREKDSAIMAARIKQHKIVFGKRHSFCYVVSPFCRSFSKDAGSIPRACLKIGDVSSSEGFWAAGKQFFRRNPGGFQGKIAPSRGQKTRRLGMLTFFKQALEGHRKCLSAAPDTPLTCPAREHIPPLPYRLRQRALIRPSQDISVLC